MIDKDKLNKAFSLMRKAGLMARQNFSCCSSCAGYALAKAAVDQPAKKRAKIQGTCFYHRQDADNLRDGHDLMLRYGPLDTEEHGQIGLETVEVGRLVVDCLAVAGLNYEWSGNPRECITVLA